MKYEDIIHRSVLVHNRPVRLCKLGKFRQNNNGTFTIEQKKWRRYFLEQHRLDPENTSLEFASSCPTGVYVFWYLGEFNLNDLNTYHLTKGKQVKDDKQLPKTDSCWKISDKNDKGNRFLMYKTEWEFTRKQIGSTKAYPLYVGKSTNVQWRINKHLDWPTDSAKHDLFYGEEELSSEDPVEIRSPNKYTLVQFRKGFEFLFRSVCDEKRRKILKYQIGISFIPMQICDFQERFFIEDYLIGYLRPPFNVDSER